MRLCLLCCIPLRWQESPLCPPCEQTLVRLLPQGESGCPRCGRPLLGLAGSCWECREQKLPLGEGRGLYDYSGRICDLISMMKSQGRRSLAGWWGRLAARMAEEGPWPWAFGSAEEPLWIVPLAPNPRSRRLRGWDPVLRAAEMFCRLDPSRSRRLVPGFRRRPGGAAQKALSAENRALNLKGRLLWTGPDPQGKRILLWDDVRTTGSTLKTAADLLLERKALSVSALWLASDRRRA